MEKSKGRKRKDCEKTKVVTMTNTNQLPRFVIMGDRKYEVLGYKTEKTKTGFKKDTKAMRIKLVELMNPSVDLRAHPPIGSEIMTTWPISSFVKHELIY